jgi:protein-S-isoprenylcysteine O-methyltransferase Ste14
MHIYADIVGFAWILWVLIWLVAALSAKKNVRRNWSWISWRLVIIVLFFIALHYQLVGNAGLIINGYTANPALAALGALLTVLGLALAVWARVYLGRNWGMPMSHKAEPDLVTTGPYATIRHPIYTGVLLAFIGTSLTLGWWYLIVFVIAASYFIYAATKEEQLMLSTFPSTYPAYKARTSMLVPFIF